MQKTKKLQIYDLLKKRLEEGYYPPGSQLPKEVDLALELGVSRITLRPALELLELEGMILRIKGQGTFVQNKKEHKARLLVIFDRTGLQGLDRFSCSFFYILPCIRLAAERNNVTLEFCESATLLASLPAVAAEKIRKMNIEGILLLARFLTEKEPIMEVLRQIRLPIILPHAFEDVATTPNMTVMYTDYKLLTKDGLKYLAAQGHRRIGYIGRKGMRNISEKEYFQWVRESGMDPDPALLQLTEQQEDREKVFPIMENLMHLPEPPTAIFCFSDVFALLVYEYLHKNDIRIPEEVCVLSIGGQIDCDFQDPPLSALEFGSQEIANEAIKILLEMIHDHRRTRAVVTPHRLAVRESTRRILFHQKGRKKKAPEIPIASLTETQIRKR